MRVAEAALASARASVDVIDRRLELSTSEIARAEAAVAAARAERSQAGATCRAMWP
ncbi:hypothetical protein ACFQ4K_18530 [Tistrella bauzanensis]